MNNNERIQILTTMALNVLRKESLENIPTGILSRQVERAAVLVGKLGTEEIIKQIVEDVIVMAEREKHRGGE